MAELLQCEYCGRRFGSVRARCGHAQHCTGQPQALLPQSVHERQQKQMANVGFADPPPPPAVDDDDCIADEGNESAEKLRVVVRLAKKQAINNRRQRMQKMAHKEATAIVAAQQVAITLQPLNSKTRRSVEQVGSNRLGCRRQRQSRALCGVGDAVSGVARSGRTQESSRLHVKRFNEEALAAMDPVGESKQPLPCGWQEQQSGSAALASELVMVRTLPDMVSFPN